MANGGDADFPQIVGSELAQRYGVDMVGRESSRIFTEFEALYPGDDVAVSA